MISFLVLDGYNQYPYGYNQNPNWGGGFYGSGQYGPYGNQGFYNPYGSYYNQGNCT